MTNAAAVNRVLLVSDTPARAAGQAAKIRRYRFARVRLMSGAGERTGSSRRTRG